MIATDEYIAFLIKYELTQGQYLLLHLLKEKRTDLIRKYKEAFPTEDGSMISKFEIKDLVDKGFLIKVDKKFKLSPELMEIFVTPEIAVDEIYHIFPSFMSSDKGVDIPLKSMDKNVFKELYIPKIKGSVKEHKEVLKDIQYGIDNHKLSMGINKFLTSEHWKTLRELRQQANPSTTPSIDKDF